MGNDRMKNAAEWFYSKIFRDEAIKPKPSAPSGKLPALLHAARSLETVSGNAWSSREAIFLKQAKLLAEYEDDHPYDANIVRYFPTYQSLTDEELRGYFSWRTKLRKGEVRKTSLTYAFLYIYELIGQVGAADPLDGYQKLTAFREAYGKLDSKVIPYLDSWLTDYVVYYELDASLLADDPQVLMDRSISVLDLIGEQDEAKVMFAVKQLAPRWLSRSKFYRTNQADCDTVIVRTLRRVSHHYATRTQKTMVEQFFGRLTQSQIPLFHSAIFCDPLKKRNCEYVLDERRVYRCKNGVWYVTKHTSASGPHTKLENILKTIDAIMREETAYASQVKYEDQTKWLIKVIREEVRTLLAEKRATEEKKITIDYSQLARIRREAAITQDKLTVEEELEDPPPMDIPTPAAVPPPPTGPDVDSPLSGPEYRLLQCLLYGGSIAWVQTEGHMLSVLVDSINEKLYDTFMDSVLDDTPELIEDYIEGLKEMVTP